MPILKIEAFHVDEHTAVDRRVGACQNTRHHKWVMHLAVVGTVRGSKRIAGLEAQLGGHRRPQHAAEKLVVAKVPAGRERKRPAVADRESVEIGRIGADHTKPAVVVPHADRHRGLRAGGERAIHAVGPLGRGQKLLVEVPGDVLDRLADEVDAVEHQLQRAPLGADDHVVAQA